MLLEASKSKSSFIARLFTAIIFSQLCMSSLYAQVESKANELLQQMTLEEKVGQLNQYNDEGHRIPPPPGGEARAVGFSECGLP